MMQTKTADGSGDARCELAMIPIAEVRPGNNPRKDFGDIDALVERIRVLGGQPLNPIVVWRDANRYRLMDGERRYRAMRKLAGDDGLVRALVFDNASEAMEAIAMIATDDKKRLNDDEEARGFQAMLALGVPEQDMARAMHRSRADVSRASKVARLAEAAQSTIDQMVAASEFADERDRQAVLKAAPDKWQAAAERIRRREAKQRLREEFMDAAALIGAEVLDEQPDGYASIVTAYDDDELKRYAAEHEGERLVMWPCAWNDSYWVLGHPATKHEAEVETPEQRERRELRERREHALQTFKDSLFEEVATSDVCPAMQRAAAGFRAIGWNSARDRIAGRIMELKADELEEKYRQLRVDNVIGSEMSTYELAALLVNPHPYVEWYDFVCTLYPAAVEEGWWPCEDAEWLHEQATAVRAAAEERERDDGDDERDDDDDSLYELDEGE